MMRIFRRAIVILTIPCIVLAAICLWMTVRNNDAPIIKFSTNGDIKVPSSCTDKELLQYVSAYDQKDGDVSENIVVQRSSYFLEKGKTVITFAAYDSDNNVAKKTRNVVFTDYRSPDILLHGDLIITQGNTVNLMSFFTAEDVIDGNISQNLKLLSSSYNCLVPDSYPINCKVTNRFGDSREVNMNVLVVDEDYSRVTIKLSEYLLFVKAGEMPDFSSYVTGVVNKMDSTYSVENVRVDSSQFDSNAAGTYDVFYTITSGGSVVTKTRMIVVVEE